MRVLSAAVLLPALGALVAGCAVLLGAALLLGRVMAGGHQIAYVSDRDGNEEIYLFDVARSRSANLTRQRSNERRPMWSPDGRYLAFFSDRDGNTNLYVLDFDDMGLRRLTDNRANYRFAAWSPTGSRLVYASTLWEEGRLARSALSVITVDGDLLAEHESTQLIYAPVWSLDGTRIRFDMQDGSGFARFQMSADGGGVVSADRHDDTDWDALGVAMPRGGLALTTLMTRGYSDVCLVDLSTDSRRCVTGARGRNFDPTWRPRAPFTPPPRPTPGPTEVPSLLTM